MNLSLVNCECIKGLEDVLQLLKVFSMKKLNSSMNKSTANLAYSVNLSKRLASYTTHRIIAYLII